MPVPVTRGNQLIADLNARLIASSRYVSPDEFWFRRTLAEAEKIKATNPAEGHNVIAQLYALVGDMRAAIRHIDIAIRHQPDANLVCNKAVMLSNLGFFSEAVDPFTLAMSPEHGLFVERWEVGLCVGAFHTLASFLQRAIDLQLRDLELVDSDLIKRAASLMDEISLTDQTLASALDVAGEMLREQRVFFAGNGPAVTVWEDDLERHLALTYKLALPNRDVMLLDEELGHRLFEKCGDLPAELMIHFDSGTPVDEHHAAKTYCRRLSTFSRSPNQN